MIGSETKCDKAYQFTRFGSSLSENVISRGLLSRVSLYQGAAQFAIRWYNKCLIFLKRTFAHRDSNAWYFSRRSLRFAACLLLVDILSYYLLADRPNRFLMVLNFQSLPLSLNVLFMLLSTNTDTSKAFIIALSDCVIASTPQTPDKHFKLASIAPQYRECRVRFFTFSL